MATITAGAVHPLTVERSAATPWYVWCSVAAVTSAMVGVHWDISWHRSIGRDTFWTPAHIAIYLCGVLAGISCGYLILATTFGRVADELREASVKMWGFRGPLGAFVAAWGGVAMLTSAPFDNWWHDAYGLDVRIISPPHTVLALGMFAVMLGTLLLVLARLNRSAGEARRQAQWLYLFVGGMVLVNIAVYLMERSPLVFRHSAIYYRALSTAVPLFLVALAVASPVRWAATKCAAMYMGFWLAINWILPLFPAEPKLGPVLHPVTHFVPSFFPTLLVVPAVAIDWLVTRRENWPRWKLGLVAGAVFVALLVAVEWPFSEFLLKSDWTKNWFFFANARDYRMGPNAYSVRRLFFPWEKTTGEFWTTMAIALGSAMVTSYLGLAMGQWLRRIKR